MIMVVVQYMELKKIVLKLMLLRDLLKQLLSQVNHTYIQKGFRHLIYHALITFYDFTYYIFLFYFKSTPVFYFQGEAYHYFFHWYNHTWKNERAIEVPIILKEIQYDNGKRILEVGNVLSHYIPCYHNIIDKYEKADDIINQDVVDFHPQTKYDLIVSISTLEHVGWDEWPKEQMKSLRALDNLKSLLTDGGKLIFTLPFGYNTELDKFLLEDNLWFKKYYIKKISHRNWLEVNVLDDFSDIRYDFASHAANMLIIGYYKNKK